MVGREIPSIGVVTAKRGRANKINTGEGRKKRKTAAYTCRGLGLDAASSCCFCFLGFFISPTSYWVISPLGSTGSSHLRKIMSSSGVKVRDSGAMPPGTAEQKRHEL